MSQTEIARVLGKDFGFVQDLARTLYRDPENRAARARLTRIVAGYTPDKLAALKAALGLGQ